MLESAYKTNLIQKLYTLYPSAMIMHLDPTEFQGIPDLITLFSSIGFLFIYEYNSFVSPRKYSAIG